MSDAADLLREHGVPITAQRLAVLRAVSGRPHGTAEAFVEDVRTEIGDNHHHLICRSCEKTVDVNCAVGETPCLTTDDGAGFQINETEVIYWSRYHECLAETSRVRD